MFGAVLMLFHVTGVGGGGLFFLFNTLLSVVLT